MIELTQHIERTLTNHFHVEIKAYWEDNVINALLPNEINPDEVIELTKELIIGGNIYIGESAIGNILVVEL